MIRCLITRVPPVDWGAAWSCSSLAALLIPHKVAGFYLLPSLLTPGTVGTWILWHHHGPESFLSAPEAGCFKDWKYILKSCQKLHWHNVFLKILFFPFITKLWGTFSRLLCWHFLLLVVNLLLVLNSCEYQIWYVLYSLLVLHYSLFIIQCYFFNTYFLSNKELPVSCYRVFSTLRCSKEVICLKLNSNNIFYFIALELNSPHY